jgi:hypothetical protein
VLAALFLLQGGCAFAPSEDLCPPIKWRAGFLSQGDCILTRSEVFGGHEWITHVANQELDYRDQLPATEIDHVIEGNRRVDFPKELLVHLNNSIIDYTNALLDYHDKPENQPLHFLLDHRNTSEEAAAAAQQLVRENTLRAVELWNQDRVRALTLLGRACHTIQDGYCEAHTVRDQDEPACVRQVKAYMKRDPGFDEGVLYHGGRSGDTVGHVTPEDSIYLEGRQCRDPEGEDAVRECMRPHAWHAVYATRDYLRMVSRLVGEDDAEPDPALDQYIEQHLDLCDW